MKVLFVGGNLAKTLADWLKEQGEVVIYTEDKVNLDFVKEVKPKFIVSYNYKYIIPKEIIDFVNGKAVNLHISYLPWNRGYYPNVWSFLEETPRGVTIHYIDEGIDTGDVIVQEEVFIDEEKETLKSSYDKLNEEIQKLFKENWGKIKSGKIKPKKQMGGGVSTTSETVSSLSPLLEKRDGIHLLESLRKNGRFQGLILRKVEEKDCDNIYYWRNDEETRKASFHSEPILYEVHKEWFNKSLNDSNRYIYIAEDIKGNKIGVVRLDKRNDYVAEFNINLAPEMRGKGYGVGLIQMACQQFLFEAKTVLFLARVKQDNPASIKMFKKAGFFEMFDYSDKRWGDVIVLGRI